MSLISAALLAAALAAPVAPPAVAATSAASAAIEGPDYALVPADAHFLAHVDLVALQRSTLFQLARELGDMDLDDLAEVEQRFGIHPLNDVRSITLYGTQHEPDRLVAILRVDAKVDAALQAVAQQPGYEAMDQGGETVHLFHASPSDAFYGWVTAAPGGADRLVLLSNDLATLSGGIELAKGRGASLASSPDAKIRARPNPSSFAFVAAGTPFADSDWDETASRIAGLTRELVLDVGEEAGSLFVHASIVTENVEDAMNVSQVLMGLKGLLALGMTLDEEIPPEIGHLVNALQVNVRGQEVQIDFRFEARALVEDLQRLDAR